MSILHTTDQYPAKEVVGSAVVGAVTFPAILAAAQTAIFKPLRLTYSQGNKATSLYGGLSVCAAGFVASLATAKTFSLIHTTFSLPENNSKQSTLSITGVDVLVSAVSSAVIFRALGGRFSAVLPSHLLRPGAFAKEWLPAIKGPRYATDKEKEVIQTFGKRYGCHSCGKKRGTSFVCDHQPPTKCLLQNETNSNLSLLQRFYPQCNRCSLLQGGLLNSNGANGTSLKFIRTHPFRLRLYHTFLPIPLAIAYLRGNTVDTKKVEDTKVEVQNASQESEATKMKNTSEKGVQVVSTPSSKRTLHTLIHESDIDELVSNFPLLIVWNKLVGFLDSFRNPGDAFHVTLWAFVAIAAWGTR